LLEARKPSASPFGIRRFARVHCPTQMHVAMHETYRAMLRSSKIATSDAPADSRIAVTPIRPSISIGFMPNKRLHLYAVPLALHREGEAQRSMI